MPTPRLLAALSALLILGAAIIFLFGPEASRTPSAPPDSSPRTESASASPPVSAPASTPTHAAPPPPGAAASEATKMRSPSVATSPAAPAPIAVPSPSPRAPAASARESELARIETAIATAGPESLSLLASYLTHADPELRAFAREGMVQKSLPEAIPLLREAAGKTKDPREAIALLDAADFLSLPTLPSTGDGARQRTKGPPPEQTRPPGRPASWHP